MEDVIKNTDKPDFVSDEKQPETEVKNPDQNGEVAQRGETEKIGKFSDAKSLLASYETLQAEFTKRCQREKALEAELATEKSRNASENAEKVLTEADVPESVKKEIVRKYVEGLALRKTAVVMTEGKTVRTPADKPKTVDAAAAMAKEYFRLKKEK